MAIIPSPYSALVVDELPILDLLANMGNALKVNPELAAWALSNYGQPVTVFSGSDPDNPPGQESCPLVEIFPGEDNHGLGVSEYRRTIGMVCELYDPALATTTHNDFNIQQGILRLEEMYRLALAAVATADLLGGYIFEVRGERADDSLFPFYLVGAEITIIKPV